MSVKDGILTMIVAAILFALPAALLRGPVARAESPEHREAAALAGPGPLAVIAPLDFELAPLLETLPDAQERQIAGVRFWTASGPGGARLVLAVCGTGKVNTALTTTLLIREFEPSAVIMIGTAGSLSPSWQAGDVCISSSVCYHDMGILKDDGVMPRGFRSPVPGKRTPVVFDADKSMAQSAVAAAAECTLIAVEGTPRPPQARTGVIACGDAFLGSQERAAEIARRLKADAIEMEGAALAQVCDQFSIPWLVIRGVCDSSGEDSGFTFQRLGHVAAQNAAAVAAKLIAANPLENGARTSRLGVVGE